MGIDYGHGSRLFFFDKKAGIDFNEYENRLLEREFEDRTDLNARINLLFEKRSEPHTHPMKEVVKTERLRDIFEDLVTNAKICEDGLYKP